MARRLNQLDHTISYDANGNVAGMIDGVDGSEARTLNYDGRDRLTSASQSTTGDEN